jgi:glutaconate CoA-transferase, subunit A
MRIAELVKDGDSVALEGFTHLIPTAAGHEIIRQERRHLPLIRTTPDIIYDQMIGMGCAEKLVFYEAWDSISRDCERFREWMGHHVIGSADCAEYLESTREEGSIEV